MRWDKMGLKKRGEKKDITCDTNDTKVSRHGTRVVIDLRPLLKRGFVNGSKGLSWLEGRERGVGGKRFRSPSGMKACSFGKTGISGSRKWESGGEKAPNFSAAHKYAGKGGPRVKSNSPLLKKTQPGRKPRLVKSHEDTEKNPMSAEPWGKAVGQEGKRQRRRRVTYGGRRGSKNTCRGRLPTP